LKPSSDLHGLTLANRLNCFLRAKLRDWCPLPTGVARGPFKPIFVALTESMARCGMRNFPSTPLTGVTSTASHWIGAPAASKIFSTLADISLPIPSPGMSVTFRNLHNFEKYLKKIKKKKKIKRQITYTGGFRIKSF